MRAVLVPVFVLVGLLLGALPSFGGMPDGWVNLSSVDFSAKPPENAPKRLLLPSKATVIAHVGTVERPGATTEEPNPLERIEFMSSPEGVYAEYFSKGLPSLKGYQIDAVSFYQASHKYFFDIVKRGEKGGLPLANNSSPFESPAFQGQFPGIYWFTPETFLGTGSLGSTDVYIYGVSSPFYERSQTVEEPPESSAETSEEEAKIKEKRKALASYSVMLDQKTLRPIQLISEDRVYRFEYKQSSSPIPAPDGYLKMHIDRYFSEKRVSGS